MAANYVLLKGTLLEITQLNLLSASMLARPEYRADVCRLLKLCYSYNGGDFAATYLIKALNCGKIDYDELKKLKNEARNNSSKTYTENSPAPLRQPEALSNNFLVAASKRYDEPVSDNELIMEFEKQLVAEVSSEGPPDDNAEVMREECIWALGFLSCFRREASQIPHAEKMQAIEEKFEIFKEDLLKQNEDPAPLALEERLCKPATVEDLIDLCKYLLEVINRYGILSLYDVFISQEITHPYLSSLIELTTMGLDAEYAHRIITRHQIESESALRHGEITISEIQEIAVCSCFIEALIARQPVYFFKSTVDDFLKPSWR